MSNYIIPQNEQKPSTFWFISGLFLFVWSFAGAIVSVHNPDDMIIEAVIYTGCAAVTEWFLIVEGLKDA